ncbi:MAG: helix-turn-helix domain-containing protein [Brevundimonas sp.]
MAVQHDALDPIDVHVGAQLRALRQRERLTQAKLAQSLGVTFQQVQKYERGVNRMAASTLAKASAALGCSVMDFYPKVDGSGEPSRGEVLDELANLYDSMGGRQRAALLGTARALATVR